MPDLRKTDVQFVKGIGPARANLLRDELKINSVHDLLHFFPREYVDRQHIYTIASFCGEMPSVQVKGRFVNLTTVGEGVKTRLVGLFTDGTGTMEVVWFRRIKSIRQAYNTGIEYILFGKPQSFNGHWSIVHPEIDKTEIAIACQGLRGVYPLTEKLRNSSISSRSIFQWVQTALAVYGRFLVETLPAEIRLKYRLASKAEALQWVHNPPDHKMLQQARERLKFEELFYLQTKILLSGHRRSAMNTGRKFPRIGRFFNSFYTQTLPFPLTNAQKKVMKEIRTDLGSGKQMNRLLQGDVGSGKTIVALMTMLIALDNGTQACIMAPTEILATQHYESLRKMVAPLGINVRLLTGSTRAKARAEIDGQLLDGSLHILVGTHAVIEERVKFHDLGLVVIDEQHRFGVMQRARLWAKNSMPPHVLVMTATPIPRTLAMTLYGDLDVSVIDELPPGRKPITTLLRYEQQRMDVLKAVGRQLALGRQAYIVFPLIEENEKLQLQSLQEGYDFVREAFPSYKIAMVHGKMKPAEKDYQMNLFASREAQILVATTVIEVGVNVPNASVMVIENAERFGLSQLHQLRGRVGRGADQSYCVLMTKIKISGDTRKRLELMTATTDGFIIAEADLKMRGPGDIEGTMQSGIPLDLRIANLAMDGQLIQTARTEVENLLENDPDFRAPSHDMIRPELHALFPPTSDLSRIS